MKYKVKSVLGYWEDDPTTFVERVLSDDTWDGDENCVSDNQIDYYVEGGSISVGLNLDGFIVTDVADEWGWV